MFRKSMRERSGTGPGEEPARRACRRLLRLLPETLRARFAGDMEELFMARWLKASETIPRAWVWFRALTDVGLHAITERARTAWTRGRETSEMPLSTVFRDLKHGIRSLRSAPLLTGAVLATLGLGIGASTATFSVVHAVLLERLPYDDPDRLVVVWPEVNVNKALAIMAEDRMRSLQSVSGMSSWTLTLTGAGSPTEITGIQVSPHHFTLLGVQPSLGRTFAEEEALPGAAGVVILSHDFWVRAFGADAEVMGQSFDIAGADYDRRTVIGVMSPNYRHVDRESEVWIPLEGDPALSIEEDRTWYVNTRIGRLAPGATMEQANAEVKDHASEVRERLPGNFGDEDPREATVQSLRDFKARDVGRALWVALGAVSLVLLIACANVANLLMARGDARAGDLAVRAALGAGRARILVMLLSEATLLGLLGGALGVAIAYGLVDVIATLAPEDFPAVDSITLNGATLAFALLTTSIATTLAAVLPAWRSSGIHTTAAIGGSSRGASVRRLRFSPLLVGGQVALAVVVAVGSGLMLRSLESLISTDPGLDGIGVVTFKPSPQGAKYPDGPAIGSYYSEVFERVSALPGVESVGAIHLLPGTTGNWSFPTFPEGVVVAEGEAIPNVNIRLVRGDYFRAVRIPIAAGRPLSNADRGGTESVLVVNEAFAEKFWSGQNALGRSVRLFSRTATPFTVVGVVGDVRQHSPATEPRPEMYYSQDQVPWDQMALHVMLRFGSGDPLAQAANVRDVVWAIDADVPVTQVTDMGSVLVSSTRTTRFLTVLLSAFGGLAIVLGGIGVLGVTAYTVGWRVPEFGVRIALGSSRTSVLGAALRRSLVPAAIGLAVGLGAATMVSKLLESVLYGVDPVDPTTFVGVTIILGGVAVVAAAIPAWRASRVDPVRVLASN